MIKPFFSTAIPSLLIVSSLFLSCGKSGSAGSSPSFTETETAVMNDFVNQTAVPQYNGLVTEAALLNGNIVTLLSNPSDSNLHVAQASWKSLRQAWERCEGFLIGPVESNDYDPNADTWPTDYHQMDSLLSNPANPLSESDVQQLPQTLRGYHPIEYLLFGVGGARKAVELDARKTQYLASLAADLGDNNIIPLQANWVSGAGNYSAAILNAGPGNAVYSSRQAFFLDIAADNGMAGICNEVGQQNEDGKMYNPFITKDSSLAESPYSGNSLTDFKNNIVGVQQVYMGLNGGKGIKDLVAARNKSLDNRIQAAIVAAINSFDNISGADNMRFELAIFQRRTQIQATMNQLNILQDLLENELVDFIKQYVKD